MLGNGITIPITHLRNSTLSYGSHAMSLKQLLCTPQLEKNLISVRKLCEDSNICVEFYPIISL